MTNSSSVKNEVNQTSKYLHTLNSTLQNNRDYVSNNVCPNHIKNNKVVQSQLFESKVHNNDNQEFSKKNLEKSQSKDSNENMSIDCKSVLHSKENYSHNTSSYFNYNYGKLLKTENNLYQRKYDDTKDMEFYKHRRLRSNDSLDLTKRTPLASLNELHKNSSPEVKFTDLRNFDEANTRKKDTKTFNGRATLSYHHLNKFKVDIDDNVPFSQLRMNNKKILNKGNMQIPLASRKNLSEMIKNKSSRKFDSKSSLLNKLQIESTKLDSEKRFFYAEQRLKTNLENQPYKNPTILDCKSESENLEGMNEDPFNDRSFIRNSMNTEELVPCNKFKKIKVLNLKNKSKHDKCLKSLNKIINNNSADVKSREIINKYIKSNINLLKIRNHNQNLKMKAPNTNTVTKENFIKNRYINHLPSKSTDNINWLITSNSSNIISSMNHIVPIVYGLTDRSTKNI